MCVQFLHLASVFVPDSADANSAGLFGVPFQKKIKAVQLDIDQPGAFIPVAQFVT